MSQHTELRLELTKNLKWNGLLGVWLIKHHELIGLIERAADALQALEPDDSGIVPDSDKVICPGCSHQFTAIPGNVQARLQALERVPMTTADMVNVVKAAGWPADTNDRQLVAAFNLIEATEAHHGITPPESKG